MKALVVDDDPIVSSLIQEVLEIEGHQCVVAPDVARAEEALGQHAFDAITLDMHLPGMDGVDWLENLHARHPELASRTIVVSGDDPDEPTLARIVACGACTLRKPFDIVAFATTIARFEGR